MYLDVPKILALLQATELLSTIIDLKWHIANQAFGSDKDLNLKQGSIIFQLVLDSLCAAPMSMCDGQPNLDQNLTLSVKLK